MFLRLRLRFSLECGSDGVLGIKTGFSWNPHFSKASLYVLMLLLKTSSFDDNWEILLADGFRNLPISSFQFPISSRDEYEIQLVSKVERLIKRMRWKALEYLGKLNNSAKETWGFKPRKCLPVVKELVNF